MQRRNTLSNQIIQRVILLAVIAVIGVIVTINQSLQGRLDEINSKLLEASKDSANVIRVFISTIETDLRATGETVSLLDDYDEIFRKALDRQPAIFELILLDQQGKVLAQRRRVGGQTSLTLADQPWLETVQANDFYVGPVSFEEFGVPFADMAVAVPDDKGKFSGILLARVDLTAIWNIVVSQKIGETGYVYVTDENGQIIAYRELRLLTEGSTVMSLTTYSPDQIIEQGVNNYAGVSGQVVMSSGVQLDIVPWYVLVDQPIQEALGPFIQSSVLFFLLIVLVGGLVISIILFIQRRIVAPLNELRQGVEIISSGGLDHQIDVQSQDELGQLAGIFNDMTSQIQELVGSLEQQVADRTRALETSTEVSRRLSTILDPPQLVREVVEQLQTAFGFYHAHIYFYDDTKQNLEMRGGTGEAGQAMLASGHKIETGQGLVGQAAESNQIVLIPDVTQAEGWLPNPLLPDTKAEVAVPIAIGRDVLGVLDVQHNVTEGITDTDADLIQSIANQVAVAVQNAEAYTRAQNQAAREAQIAAINQRIQSAASIEDVLKVAVSELGRTLGSQSSVELKVSAPSGDGRN